MKKEQFEIHAKLGMRHWWHHSTKYFFLHLLTKHMPAGSLILDAGCGVGDMILLLKNKYRVVGIDASKDAVNYCSRKGIAEKVILGDVSSLPFDDNSIDGIVSLDVLYHEWVADDMAALKEMYRALKPGGKVFIQLPAYSWLRSDHDRWALSSRRYTARQLSSMLAEAGFRVKRVGYRVFFLFPLAVVRRLFFRNIGSDMKEINPVMNFLLNKIMSFENLLSLFISFPCGLSVFGVAEK